MSDTLARLTRVVEAIRGHRFGYVNEDELQRGLAEVLTGYGLPVEREVCLDNRSRIDLLVGRVGVEVKVGGSASALRHQAERYAESDRLDAVVIVTSRLHHGLPPGWCWAGKRILVVRVGVL